MWLNLDLTSDLYSQSFCSSGLVLQTTFTAIQEKDWDPTISKAFEVELVLDRELGKVLWGISRPRTNIRVLSTRLPALDASRNLRNSWH